MWILGLKWISQFQEHPSPLSLILIRPFTEKEAGWGTSILQLWGCSSSYVGVQVTDFGVTYGVQDGKPVFLPKKSLPRVVGREISV